MAGVATGTAQQSKIAPYLMVVPVGLLLLVVDDVNGGLLG